VSGQAQFAASQTEPETSDAAAEERLVASGLRKSYRKRVVVHDASFHVQQGEVVGLLGPNGAGKTTCFRMVVGLTRADAGTVRLGGRDLTALPMHRRCRLGMGYLPQEPSIFRKLTVRQNFTSILELTRCPHAERRAREDALLSEFNLETVQAMNGESLSGGERRRAEIARSLISEPRFMLFDEPFAGVDPLAVGEIQSLVRRLRGRGLGILISDHNARETLAIADRVYLIAEGGIMEHGTPQQIAASPRARALYLGESFRLH
jgi:lipopolysaccharide export system ATP-binding protein